MIHRAGCSGQFAERYARDQNISKLQCIDDILIILNDNKNIIYSIIYI